MKTKRSFSTVLLFTSAIIFTSSTLSAWTIQVLSAENDSGHSIPSRGGFSTFTDYIKDTDADLILGKSLASYKTNDSNAVIVNLANAYTQAEINVLKQLLISDTRVLIFGEHNGWANVNQDIASIVGGIYSGEGESAQKIISNAFPTITNGITDVYLSAVGKISPANGNGISLTDDDGLTLWGTNNNFLVILDVDSLSGSIGDAENDQLARNIASFLSGANITIPEPSTYSLIAGLALLGGSIIRRRR